MYLYYIQWNVGQNWFESSNCFHLFIFYSVPTILKKCSEIVENFWWNSEENFKANSVTGRFFPPTGLPRCQICFWPRDQVSHRHPAGLSGVCFGATTCCFCLWIPTIWEHKPTTLDRRTSTTTSCVPPFGSTTSIHSIWHVPTFEWLW